MRIYLRCGEDREGYFRDILEADFALGTFPPGGHAEPGAGDVVLVDLAAAKTEDWHGQLETLRRGLGEEVKILAVLRYEQIRSLDNRARLDDFVADGGTGEEIRARLRLMSLEEREAAAVGELEVDEDRYEVRVGGAIVDLTFKEFELLRFLVSRPGKVFTREVLLEQVWGYDYFGGARTVDVHVRRIRAKIEREGHAYIRTIRGVGYIFEHRCMD
ncbi:MAG: winged-helix domain-containing protein [Actinomycetota bacterium]|nr:winged-helix domain-containing protein [Actinomycetota bacterium]MDD5665675.1 winged-helix domain-containing protein [Actinomycetota bacterium]